MRSETEIKDVRELFLATGDDSPAMNTAVRDTLTWVLGGISTEELIEHYLVVGAGYQCFTCPAGTTITTDLGREAHIEVALLLLNTADRLLQRIAEKTPSPQTTTVTDRLDLARGDHREGRETG